MPKLTSFATGAPGSALCSLTNDVPGVFPLFPEQVITTGTAPATHHDTQDRIDRVMDDDSENKDVLVVEDEPYLCDLIADVLEAEGHTARKASNGLEALAQVAERRPQLILLDLMMPVMDGWEFLSELRSHKSSAAIPVVIITAVYDVARTQQQTGARAVISKPFDIDQLADVVRSYAS
jgi:CheY-like chemotaxis protein